MDFHHLKYFVEVADKNHLVRPQGRYIFHNLPLAVP